MFTYTGGAYDSHAATGYSFTHNFFSDLGRLTAQSGQPNWVSAVLFFIALSIAGASLAIFFILYPRLFTRGQMQHLLCLAGSVLGILAGISFIGVAFAPADINLVVHTQFVIWAFRLFPLAVLCYVPALFMDKNYPRRYAWVFALFCALLIGYYLLITTGPHATAPQGLVIQAIGQKVIVYASIISISIQSFGAYRYLKLSQ